MREAGIHEDSFQSAMTCDFQIGLLFNRKYLNKKERLVEIINDLTDLLGGSLKHF